MAKNNQWKQWGPMGDFLNNYCKVKGTQPQFDYAVERHSRTQSGFTCTMTIPATGETMQAAGATKQDAQESVVRNFVVKLQASGVMFRNARNRSEPDAPTEQGPSWKLAGVAGIGITSAGVGKGKGKSKGKKGDGGGTAKAITEGSSESSAGKAISNEIAQLRSLLRTGQAEVATSFAEEKLAEGATREMTVTQLATLMTSVGVSSLEPSVLRFFDTLCALNLVEFPSPQAASYFMRFGRWALREFLAEAQSAVEMASKQIAIHLERTGSCIAQLSVCPGKWQDELVLNPVQGQLPASSSFQVGDWVLVTVPFTSPVRLRADRGGLASYEGEIVGFAAPPQVGLSIKLAGLSAAGNRSLIGQTARLDRAANHVTFRRQVNALQCLCSEPGELDWLSLALLSAEEDGGHQRVAAYCQHFPPGGGFPSASPVLKGANQSQWEALQAATTRRVSLIQGPPGAGKTSTGVMLMRLWVATGRKPVLATADSNIAADNLAMGCLGAGLQVVRVGRKEACRPELNDVNLFEKARALGQNSGPRHQWKGEKKVLEAADVVCCTCAGAEHPAMQDLKFRNVLVDEAGQTTELSTLIPLMHLKSDGSVVLIGDHRQLAATVACLEADVEGLGTSMFERLCSLGVPSTLLDVQYRMHPGIAAYPSMQYYGGRLRSGVEGAARSPPKGIDWPHKECPVVFLPIQSREQREGSSYTNRVEVDTILELLHSVLQAQDVKPSDVGIITPYAAQARLLRSALGIEGKPERGAPRPEVSSVDGFQGREKEIIFISTVRANTQGKLGFISDPRRLNVMLTRARRGLVVVGDFPTLAADEQGWRPWLAWTQERGLIAGCPPTSDEAHQSLVKLHNFSRWELMQATSAPDQNEHVVPDNCADDANGGKAEGAAASTTICANGRPPRKKSKLMQAREEASAEAARAAAS